jgi:hypothetical protein
MSAVSFFLTVLAVVIFPRLAMAVLRPYLPTSPVGVVCSLAAVPVLLVAAFLLDVFCYR